MEKDYDDSAGSERGARRRKLAGYLKAANELRQSYTQAYGLTGRDGSADEDDSSLPGSYPGVSVIRNADEEMLLFPSYARRHHARKPNQRPGSADDQRDVEGSGNAEYWRREWEKYEDDTALVDVDIRGWIYAPHRGQMTRKNRILVGIARHLSGVPAPSTSGASSRSSSPNSAHHARLEARNAKHEEELAEKEAHSIVMTGHEEADVAWRGGYSEKPSGGNTHPDPQLSQEPSLIPSPERKGSGAGQLARPLTNSSLNSSHNGDLKPMHVRAWNQPSEMSPEELSIANSHLMVRLKPFLTTPLVSLPLTLFFYNEKTSKSRTITTNDSGHFSYRAALDFIPTNVRVLASDRLSATEEVRITEPKGVSMISDIDDTIKHSAIGSGAREIFRNAFIRDLKDLYVDGVKEWYSTLADMGVQVHYVSNSPWQLYPVLQSYFAGAGLPKGSFHLKQYTGMLQGIFEPVAERKKGTLDRIMSDFPQRRFILVGDSGEADLELYTDVMLANPGRILGVYIRDVTTTSHSRGFFDSAQQSPQARSSVRDHPIDTSPRSAVNERPPKLPPRTASTRSMSSSATETKPSGPVMGNLIGFDEEPPQQAIRHSTTDPTSPSSSSKASSKPPLPSKPLSMRPALPESSTTSPNLPRKPVPVPPPKPRQMSSSSTSSSTTDPKTQRTEPSPLSQTQNISRASSSSSSSTSSQEPHSYRSAAKSKLTSAYNSLPSWYATDAASPPGFTTTTTNDTSSTNKRTAPPVPPRRNLSSYPAAAAHYATNRLSGGWSGASSDPDPTNANANANAYFSSSGDGEGPELSKKEELWMRRWERARAIFEEKGVVLRSWRVGVDVADGCVRLVEGVLREHEREREREREN